VNFDPITHKIIVAIAWIVLATLHGFGAAWLAIWMLFHPYQAKKLFGITIWPQGMIPRHREKLAQSIGNAVGNELVSQQTVFDAMFETSFFQRKVADFVGSYTNELLARVYPSFIDALPAHVRAPILDTISALQYRLAEYIADMLRSEETSEAIERFIDKQIDELLGRDGGRQLAARHGAGLRPHRRVVRFHHRRMAARPVAAAALAPASVGARGGAQRAGRAGDDNLRNRTFP